MKKETEKRKKLFSLLLLTIIICIATFSFYSHIKSNLTTSPRNSSQVSDIQSLETDSNADSNKAEKSPYDLTFAVFGDIHDNEPDFQDAIDDIQNTDINLDALILNGDSVDQGIDSQYETMINVLSKNKEKLPDKIIKNIGNHEFYDYDNGSNSKEQLEAKIQRYLNFADEDKVYHDAWINNYHFISLGSEDGNSQTNDTMTAFISDTQIQWFKEKLAENYVKGKPIFVFIHQPLTLNWGWGDLSGTNMSNTINKILSSYPESILFTSHTHKLLGDDCIDTTRNYPVIQTGAISYTLFTNDDGNSSREFSYINALYVTVTGNNVTINGRDIANKTWLFSRVLSNTPK